MDFPNTDLGFSPTFDMFQWRLGGDTSLSRCCLTSWSHLPLSAHLARTLLQLREGMKAPPSPYFNSLPDPVLVFIVLYADDSGLVLVHDEAFPFAVVSYGWFVLSHTWSSVQQRRTEWEARLTCACAYLVMSNIVVSVAIWCMLCLRWRNNHCLLFFLLFFLQLVKQGILFLVACGNLASEAYKRLHTQTVSQRSCSATMLD